MQLFAYRRSNSSFYHFKQRKRKKLKNNQFRIDFGGAPMHYA